MGCHPAPDKLSMFCWPYSGSYQNGYDLADPKECGKTC